MEINMDTDQMASWYKKGKTYVPQDKWQLINSFWPVNAPRLPLKLKLCLSVMPYILLSNA